MAATTVDNERLARRIPEEVATKGRLDLIDELCAEDVVDHTPFGETSGRDEFSGTIETMRGAFSDFTARVDDCLVDGDTVAMRVTLSGTHTGEFMGIEPTNRAFEIDNMVFTRIEDGKIVERWVQPDTLGMLQQLGVVESFER